MSQIEGDEEIKKRKLLVEKFYKLILNEPPEYVDDFDDIYGVCYKVYNKMGNEKARKYLIDKILKAYDVQVDEDFLSIDFWQALDVLEEYQKEEERQKTQKLLPKPE